MITDKRIGVLAGGVSAEREVSLRSGTAILNALKGLGYDAVFIDTAKGLYEALERERIEIAFLALHGGLGENGAIQGFLEVLGILYTGSGVLASALAMDKEASKKIFLHHGIPVAPFQVITRESLSLSGVPTSGYQQKERLRDGFPSVDFDLPWVVKPVTEGSSIGVSIVKTGGELDSALETGFSYGRRVIIEKYIKGKEIQIGILGRRALGGVEVRPAHEFYSYEAKYTPGLTQYILPPEVDEAAYDALRMLALGAHTALGCRGATRVDLILDETARPYVLEVNTIPGMTETSLLPKIARLSGLEFADLIEEILRMTVGDEQ